MHIIPIIRVYNSSKNLLKRQTQFEKNRNDLIANSHKYTGSPCADLAYASMIDNNIANELKLMGLI